MQRWWRWGEVHQKILTRGTEMDSPGDFEGDTDREATLDHPARRVLGGPQGPQDGKETRCNMLKLPPLPKGRGV